MAAVEENPLAETRGRRKSSRTGCNSPRNTRRCRRKRTSEVEEAEQPEMAQDPTNIGRRRRSCRMRKPRLSLITSAATIAPPKIDHDPNQRCLDVIEQQLSDLFMWKDMAKSSLWFGLGSLFFLSSCFAGGLLPFSFISAVSKVGLLWLGFSFLRNSCFQGQKRNSEMEWESKQLREEDLLRAWRLLLLPAANFVVSKTRDIFSGEPSVTMKVSIIWSHYVLLLLSYGFWFQVAPILLLGSEYGHLLTLWRLFAFGFFASFTLPKLWSRHSTRMRNQADHLILRVFEAWAACSHKKFVAASAVTLFWNLTGVRFRVLAVFFGLVMLRLRQQPKLKKEEWVGMEHKGETNTKAEGTAQT